MIFWFNFSKKQRKVLHWLFLVLGIISFLLTIMVPPCVTQVGWNKQVYNETEQGKIIMMVMFPFLIGIINFLLADIFRVYTKEDAIRQLDVMSDYGVIKSEFRNVAYKHVNDVNIENLREDIKRKKDRDQAELEAQIIYESAYNEEFNKQHENQENQEQR